MTSTLSDHTFSMIPVNLTPFQVPEQPSEQITVKIRVNSVSLVLEHVDTRAQLNRANMTASRDSENVIVVRGIPPDYGYGQQNILEAIQKFDKRASIIS